MQQPLAYLPAPVLKKEKEMFWKGYAIAASIAFIGLLFYSAIYPVVISHEQRIKVVEQQTSQIAEFLNKQIEQAKKNAPAAGKTGN